MNRMTLGAALAASLLAAPATARDGRVQAVRYADLRLDRPADVRRLDRRIWRAAQAVCGLAPDYDVRGRVMSWRCRTATIASVADQRERAIAWAHGVAAAGGGGRRAVVEVAATDAGGPAARSPTASRGR